MRTAAFFAFFMAMFAMLCTFATADASLEKRAPVHVATTGDAFSASVDLLLKAHEKIVVEAYEKICADLDFNAAIETNLKIKTTIGEIIKIGSEVVAKKKAELHLKVKEEIKAQVKAEIKAAIKKQFKLKVKIEIEKIIVKKCGAAPTAACIKTNSKIIVQNVAKLCVKVSGKISADLKVKLQVKIQAAIEAKLKEFTVEIKFLKWTLYKLEIEGGAEISSKLAFKFEAAAGACVKALTVIEAKLVSQVKAVCK